MEKNNIQQEIFSLEDILYAIKKRWIFIILITLAVTTLSGIMSFFVIKSKYESTTKVFIGKEENNNKDYNNSDIQMYQKLMKTYAEVVKTTDLVKHALENQNQNLQLSSQQIINNLTVIPSADTQILEIKYKSENKEQCLVVLQLVIKEFIKEAKVLIPNVNVQVIEAPVLPENPISPNKKMNIAISFLFGLMVSLLIVLLLEYINNTFKNRDDLEKHLDLPVLGVIPQYDNK